MKVALALLADYANVTREGKLNLMGLFDRINAPVVPWTHPQMQLVLSLEATPAEWDSSKNIEIRLLDADGNVKLTIGADVKVPKGEHGRNSIISSIVGINNLRFDREGDYAFHILIGGDDKETVPLRVNLAPTPKPSGT